MIFSKKALRLAVIAVTAIYLTVAGAAQASEFHVAGGPSATVRGESTTKFSFRYTGLELETYCNQFLLEGTVQGGTPEQTTATELTVVPTIAGCSIVGGPLPIHTNGCKFRVTASQPESLTALVDITGCTGGKSIETTLNTFGCTITIPEQNGLSHITFENKTGPPKDVVVEFRITGIAYELHGIWCFGGTLTTLTQDGDLSGDVTLRSFADEGTQQVTKHGHQYNEPKAGQQQDFEVRKTPTGATITGEQTEQLNFKLTGSGAETKCTQGLFESTLSGDGKSPVTATEFSLTPRYTGCQTVGLSSTVEMNGCKYTVTGGQINPQTALVDIAGCTAGKTIVIKLTGCTITVLQQNSLSHITFEEKAGPPKDILANFTMTGIGYELHGIACLKPGSTTTLTLDGDLTGKVTLRAYEDLGTEEATHNSHQYEEALHGAQLDFLGL